MNSFILLSFCNIDSVFYTNKNIDSSKPTFLHIEAIYLENSESRKTII